MRRSVTVIVAAALACSGGGCESDGSFELVLALPDDPALRPIGMTTVTVVMTEPGAQPVATTSVLDGEGFSVGDFGAAAAVRIEVQLRDVTNRLVGVGETAEPVDLVANAARVVEIPVRRPFIYASDGATLRSLDPTLDSTDGAFQGEIIGVGVPRVMISVGGDRLAVVGATSVTVIATDTNLPVGEPIALPATARDAAAIPGTRRIAVAHDQGIAIVDLDAASFQNAVVGAIDRVTVGPSTDGRLLAYGLAGRVAPALNPLASCAGSSKLFVIDVDAPLATLPIAFAEPVADLAAAADEPGNLYAALPCSDRVARVDDRDGALADFAALEHPAAVAVAGGRVIAAGTGSSAPHCVNAAGAAVACAVDAPTGKCPPSGPAPANSVDYVTDGAHLIVESIPIAGGAPSTVDLPGRRETIFDVGDPAKQHAQVLHAFGAVPLDLVALPGGQQVGVVTTSNYYIQQLTTGVPPATTISLPCLDATTSDWLVIDLSAASIAQRVRTSCELVVGPADDFAEWDCDVPPLGEDSTSGDYVPVSIGALYGAR
jgi:hypothetical protein